MNVNVWLPITQHATVRFCIFCSNTAQLYVFCIVAARIYIFARQVLEKTAQESSAGNARISQMKTINNTKSSAIAVCALFCMDNSVLEGNDNELVVALF